MDYASLDADESHADDTPQPLRIKKLVQQVSPGITSSNMNLTPESMSAPRQRSPDIMSGNMNRIVEFPSTIGQRTSDLTCSSMDMIIEYLPTPRQRSLDITSSDIAVATESMSYPQQLIYSENIPERKASLQRSHVDFTSSPYAPSPWSPQPSNQTSYLNVQKHRRAIPQTNCGDSGSLSGGLLSDPNLNTIQTSTIQEVSQAKENPVGLGITFPSNRASSAGLILPSELLSPFGEGPLIPASPTPVITRDQARAMSASEEYIEATVYEALGQSPEQNMMRHPSYKRRFFAKMSGLASRYKGKQVATGLNRSPRTSLEITSTNPEHKDDTCSKSTREGVIQDTCETSYSKMGSDDITRSFTSPPKLETASLKALPSPEKRSIGLKSQDSPTAAEGISVKEGAGQGSCNISSSEIKANNVVDLLPSPLNSNVPSRQSGLERPPSGICAYTDAIITNHYSVPNLKVSARAEIDNLDSENEQSIFVAIEIKGLLSRPEKEVVEKQLDVAIIIDNSLVHPQH